MAASGGLSINETRLPSSSSGVLCSCGLRDLVVCSASLCSSCWVYIPAATTPPVLSELFSPSLLLSFTDGANQYPHRPLWCVCSWWFGPSTTQSDWELWLNILIFQPESTVFCVINGINPLLLEAFVSAQNTSFLSWWRMFCVTFFPPHPVKLLRGVNLSFVFSSLQFRSDTFYTFRGFSCVDWTHFE